MRTIPLSVIALAVTLAAPAAEAQDYSGRVTLTDDAAVGGFVAFNIWVDDYTTDTARQRYIETLAGDGAAKLESDLLNERVGRFQVVGQVATELAYAYEFPDTEGGRTVILASAPRLYVLILIRPDQFETLHSESVAHSRTRK